MAFALNTSLSRAGVRPSVSTPRSRARMVVSASKDHDNIYHDRETTKSRRSNPAGTKDQGVRKAEKDEQYEYQQERLEWRRKNQDVDATLEGKDRVEPPVTNLAGDMSAERRGPEMDHDSSTKHDTLKEFVADVKDSLHIGKKHKEDKK